MSYITEQDADTPLSRWKFEETAGTTIDDDKTATRDGTVNGGVTLNQAASFAGAGLGASFNGSTGYISMSNMSGLLGLGSIEAVVQFNAIPGSATNPIFSHVYASTILPLVLGFNLDGSHATKLQIGYYTGSAWMTATWATTPSTATPYHIVGKYDGTTLKMRVNGAEVATITPASARPGSGTVNGGGYIGRRWDSGEFHSGTIWDVAIYSTALSDARADAHYAALTASPITDNFVNAGALTLNTTYSSIATTSWTTEVGEPGSLSHTGWATFTPTIGGRFKFSTVGSSFDTVLSVYSGTAFANLVLLRTDDNSGASNTSVFTATLSGGSTYYIQVGAQAAGAGGTLTLSLTSTSAWTATATADTPYALYDMSEPSGTTIYDKSGNSRNGSYTGTVQQGAVGLAPGTANVSVLFPGTSGNYASAVLSSWASTTVHSIEMIGQWVALRSGSANGLWQFGAESNAMVRVSDSGLRAGQLNGFTGSTTYTDPGAGNDLALNNVYHIVETTDGTNKRLYLNGALIATKANTSTIASGTLNFPWDFANGRESNMYVAGAALYTTTLSLSTIQAHYQAVVAPLNNTFLDATLLPPLGCSATGIDTTSWTTETSEPGSVTNTGWGLFTPTTSGTVRISTIGSTFNTLISVYTGNNLGGLALVASDDDSGGSGTSLLSMSVTAGTSYYVQVGTKSGNSPGTLNFSLTPLGTANISAHYIEVIAAVKTSMIGWSS